MESRVITRNARRKVDLSFFNRTTDDVALSLLDSFLSIRTEQGIDHYLIMAASSYTHISTRKITPNIEGFTFETGHILLYGRRNGHTLAVTTDRGVVSIDELLHGEEKIKNIAIKLGLREYHGKPIISNDLWISAFQEEPQKTITVARQEIVKPNYSATRRVYQLVK